jgi:hypothetical protein
MLVAQETVFVPELNAMRTAMNSLATELSASEVNAEAQVALAADQAELATTNGAVQVVLATNQAVIASNAATAASNSALAAGASVWVSGVTYSIGDAKYSPINFQTYRRKTAGAGTTDPSLDSTNWADITALPDQVTNTGKFLQTNGTSASWAFAGISQVTTATTATTLTSTPTLLQITPASYGVTVTLPDATTCSVGGPLHCIDNRGAYPVRVCNTSGTLKGFVFAGVVSYISLDNNSTAAGVWAISSNELVGASAQLLTTNLSIVAAVIDIGSSQEVIIGIGPASTNCYGVVYNRATNTFGAVTLIRTASVAASSVTAVLSGANQVLVCTCVNGSTGFEAVTLSISGTTITVNTAATATLSANMTAFADGCGLIAVGSSFVTSYTVATPAAQIRALSISGTTVTIGSASVLTGTAGGLIAAAANHVIAVSTATTTLTTTPYLVATSTLSAGTGTTTTNGTMTLNKLAALGTRWYVGYNDGGTTAFGGVVSLNTTGNGTTTISTASLLSSGQLVDAIVVGSNKVLVLNNFAAINANILTDTAGTASAGTAITLSSGATRFCQYVNGTDVLVANASGVNTLVSCSGTSPTSQRVGDSGAAIGASSNAVLSRSPTWIYGSRFVAQTALSTINYGIWNDVPLFNLKISYTGGGTTCYRGRADSERWVADGTRVITKLECVA